MIGNELTVLSMLSLLLTQSDMIVDLDGRKNAAWLIIGVICLVVLINFAIIIIVSVKESYHKCKLNKHKRLLTKHYHEDK